MDIYNVKREHFHVGQSIGEPYFSAEHTHFNWIKAAAPDKAHLPAC